jgi:hypothetical protein
MTADENHRETGIRVPREQTVDVRSTKISRDAATNRRPANGVGLTEATNDVNDRTRHSDNRSANPKDTVRGARR